MWAHLGDLTPEEEATIRARARLQFLTTPGAGAGVPIAPGMGPRTIDDPFAIDAGFLDTLPYSPATTAAPINWKLWAGIALAGTAAAMLLLRHQR